jgi:hypothetical protein
VKDGEKVGEARSIDGFDGIDRHKPIACALRQKSDSPQSRAALFDRDQPGGDRCGI